MNDLKFEPTPYMDVEKEMGPWVDLDRKEIEYD